MQRTKNLIKDTAWFALGNFGSKIVSFLLVPLYTSLLDTRQYGTIDIITTTSSILLPLLTLSIQDAVFRFAFDSEENKKGILTSGITITLVSCIALMLLRPIFRIILPSVVEYWWYFWFCFVFNGLNATFSSYIKGNGKSNIYAVQGIIYTFTFIVSNILLLVVVQAGVEGYLVSIATAYAVSFIYMLFRGEIYRDIHLSSLTKEQLSRMLRYCIPLIPASIAWWIMISIDKYMILYMCGAEANGLYSVAHKIPAVISVITTFFISAWQIAAVRIKKDSDANEYISRVFEYLMVFGMLITFAIVLLSQFIGKLMFSNEFFSAWVMTPCLTVGTIFSVYAGFLGAQFTAEKRTDLHLVSNLIAMAANVVLSYFFIRCFGVSGASYGIMLSFFILLVYRLNKIREFVALKYNKRKYFSVNLLMIVSATIASLNIPSYYLYIMVALMLSLWLMRNEVKSIIHQSFQLISHRR